MIDLRQPNIQGNDHEKIQALVSYLYQLREQLQYAFDDLEKNGVSVGGGGIIQNTTVIQGGGTTEGKPPTEEEAELTFNSIKNFIIKSSDIVESYYQKIDSMILSAGRYVAQTDFQGYQKEVEDTYVDKSNYDTYMAEVESRLNVHTTDIEINHSFTETLGARLEDKIENEVSGVNDKLTAQGKVYQYSEEYAMIRKAQGYIKAGFLGETDEGQKEYGIEIGLDQSGEGQTTKSIGRFSSQRVLLYDQNGNPGAELNNNSLLADNVIIDKKQQTGKFVDIVDARGNITTKWIGERR